MNLPPRVAIMTLPKAILFPQALLPLYIFEPRYRTMLQMSLADHRMFSICLSTNSLKPNTIGGLGLVRACVHNPDGTSNLALQGIARVKFTNFVQTEPYYIGEYEVLPSFGGHPQMEEELAGQILDLVNDSINLGQKVPDWMIKFLDELHDLEVLGDLVANTFVHDISIRQTILEEMDLHQRLLRIRDTLALQTKNSDFSFDSF